MPASEAQIRANQANAARSTGPKTEDGKARSRRNALQHGLTGSGVVMPEEDAAEVDRMTRALLDELKPPGEVGELLVRRVATLAVRMDRSFDQETAALTARVRRAMDEFEAPEGVDPETLAKLRAEAGSIALFDASKEAILARKYEAAAQRGFFQALKELRELKEASADPSPATEVAAQAKASMKRLGSFFPTQPKPAAPLPSPPTAPSKPPLQPIRPALADWDPFETDRCEVPMAIGKPR